MDYDDGLQFENLSGAESIEEDDRTDEIKQLLAKDFNDEIFDDENEHSFISNSSQSSVLHSINTNSTGPPPFVEGNHNIFFNAAKGTSAETENGLQSFFNGIGLDKDSHFNNNNNNNNNAAMNGNRKKVRFQSSPSNKGNNNDNSSSISSSGKHRQSDRGVDEIETNNPTISLLHQNHCPQNGDDEIESDLWKDSGNVEEQLKMICNMKERQVQRAEETIKTLNKDKRSLNHQIGLMKTEMIQMKNNQDNLEKVIQLRDDQIKYLKTKMTEAINEYEVVRKNELDAKEENKSYLDQIAQLKQQVELLSSIGSSTQQAEIDQVVRQIREKHSKEMAGWQAQVRDLESQLLILQRTQHSIHDESFVVERQNTSIQTDEVYNQPVPATIKTATEDFGQTVNLEQTIEQKSTRYHDNLLKSGGGDAHILLDPQTANSGFEKWKEALAKSEEDKNRLIDFYEKEVEEYKTKLAFLPAQLYTVWQKQQEELGLLYSGTNPNCSNSLNNDTSIGESGKNLVIRRDIGLVTDPHVNLHSMSTQTNNNDIPVDLKDHNDKLNEQNSTKNAENDTALNMKTYSSLQSGQKECSSVVIQTEETLETYRELGNLVQQWVKEVAASSKRAEDAEHEVAFTKEEFKNLRNKFRKFYKSTVESRKQWQEQEKLLRQKYEDSRTKCIAILSMVSEKLDTVDILHDENMATTMCS